MSEITQEITPFTTIPNRDQDTPEEFSNNVDTWLFENEAHVTEWNNLANQANALSLAVNQLKNEASLSAANAHGSKIAAEAFSNATAYNSQLTYNFPTVVIGSDGIPYRCIGSNVKGVNPVGSTTGVWQGLAIAKYIIHDVGTRSSGDIVIDLNDAFVQKINITGSVNISFTGFTNSFHSPLMLIVTAAAGCVITWSPSVKWPSTSPFEIILGARNRYMFASEDGGTTIDGHFVGGGYA